MKKWLLTFVLISCSTALLSQGSDDSIEQVGKLRISGYMQAQAQWGEADARLRVGEPNNTDGAFSRWGVRRGHLKFEYKSGLTKSVLQMDATEKKVGIKDAYFQISSPWERIGNSSLRFGLFNRPFGYEIAYSSSKRESPERASIFPILFPHERDLGAMLTLQLAKDSWLSVFKFEAGLFAGNGINPERDNKRDFIGHLTASDCIGDSFDWFLGASYYHGYVLQTTDKVYRMKGKVFLLDQSERNSGAFATREYWGLDGQVVLSTPLGKTQLRAEYLWGQQPSTQKSSKSPDTSKIDKLNTFIRPVSGGYAMLVQELGSLPLSLVAKYDWFDPNTSVVGQEVGNGQTTSADMAQSTVGVGLLWQINRSLLMQAYADFNFNEESSAVKGYEVDRQDDALTLRLQYTF
ncbi:MAG: porin [Porphyromonadaceae bacterium]|nr:porin [Porphyromonadaceae bacterium]